MKIFEDSVDTNCNMRRSFYTLIFLIIVGVGQVNAQQYTVTGSILDSTSKSPLFYVSVGIINQDSTGMLIANSATDQYGVFKMIDVPAGDYLLKATYVGYEMLSVPISLKGAAKQVDLGKLCLLRSATMLKGVTVTEAKPVYEIDGEKTMYNVSEDPGIQNGTTADALQNAPGVEVDIEGNITLRGVSSVEIWINDKPSNLNAENLKTYIQQLPANSLERIEVITNPSAKYSAKGGGGIINLITNANIKKNQFFSFGLHGSTSPNFTPWLSYVWKNKKWSINLYAHGNFSVRRSLNKGYSVSFNDNLDTSDYEYYRSLSGSKSYSGGLYFDGSYEIDSMNTLSFWGGAYGGWSTSLSSDNHFRQEYIYNPDIYRYSTDVDNKSNYLGGYFGMWYQHDFNSEGHKISTDISYSNWNNKYDFLYYRNYTEQNDLDKYKTGLNKYSIHSLNLSLDYSLPYSKTGEIEAGISGQYGNSKGYEEDDTLVNFEELIFAFDSLRFNNNLQQKNEIDVYATIQQKFGNFTVKAGLRYEYLFYDYRILNSPQDNVIKGYSGFFPSLHLSYRTKSMHNFKLSYTRRVSQPDAEQLTTFIEYSEDSYSTGNPDLLSSYTNSVEAGWTKYYQKFGSIGLSAYFKNSTDDINSISDVIYSDVFGRMVSYTMPVNSGKKLQSGGDLNVTYRLKSFMQIRLYSNLYYSYSETAFRVDELVKTEYWAWSARLNFWAKLWKMIEVNASANYRSKSKTIFTEVKPSYSIDCGIRADFFDRKLSVHINVSDIFNWNKRVVNIDNPYYISYSSVKYNSRFISCGVTLRFGKIELESHANTGASNLQNHQNDNIEY